MSSDTDAKAQVVHWRQLSSAQKKSGLAAWLGWFFDGLDLHLYTLVAMVFVGQLLGTVDTKRDDVAHYASIIQAAFLVGWAVGGVFFGRLGDYLGRSRTLVLTILTYALFTGLSFWATQWWHLMIFRFLAALGIGGEWAVGASLLSETWPKHWRPWIAAVLQCAVNLGILAAILAVYFLQSFSGYEPKWVFLVGLLPALITLWIRKAVPETEEWHAAKEGNVVPPISDLFSSQNRRTTWLVLSICAISLTAHWTFMFWQQGYILHHPEVVGLGVTLKQAVPLTALFWIMMGSLVGNFGAGALARFIGYRWAFMSLFTLYAVLMWITFSADWSLHVTYALFAAIGFTQGVFGLFTMCLPPLFPTLLRTTGAGFCYNIGRIFAAAGTVFFGIFAHVGDYTQCLFYASFLFIPVAILSYWLPQEGDTQLPSF